MSGHVIQCWSCDTRLTLGERNENDGDCLECGVEIALDDYLDQAMTERDELRAQVEAMRALMAEARLMTFVVNSGQSGVLRGQIDAALQAKP